MALSFKEQIYMLDLLLITCVPLAFWTNPIGLAIMLPLLIPCMLIALLGTLFLLCEDKEIN